MNAAQRPSTSTPATATGPVTARGARTRAALVAAAREVFEERGYLDTNVGDISKRAQVAHGSFYTYFSSKEEVFAEVADELTKAMRAVAEEEPRPGRDAPISARVERSNRGYLRGYEQHARMMGVLEQVATFNPRLAEIRRTSRRYWVERNTTAIRRWQADGLVDPRVDAMYAASALGSMVDRSAYVWLVLEEPYELQAATIQLTRLYCNALGLRYHRDDALD